MTLIKCPDCGRDVSAESPSCMGCGRPIAVAPNARPGQTIDETGRRWKKLQVTGTVEVLAALGGFFFIGNPDPVGIIAWVWLVGLLVLGFGTLSYARFGAWWQNR